MIVGKDICKPVPPYMKLLRKLATEHEPQFLSTKDPFDECLRNI